MLEYLQKKLRDPSREAWVPGDGELGMEAGHKQGDRYLQATFMLELRNCILSRAVALN